MNLPKKNWLEWAVFLVSLVLVASTLSYLAYDAATLGDAPPSMVVQLGVPEQQAQHVVVPVAVTNQGDRTAEGVRVEVVLENGSDQPERAEVEIAFLPRGATGEGWVSFQANPREGGQLRARVIGYEQP